MKKLVVLRRSSQAFFLLLFIYILWSTTYPLEGLLPPEAFFKTNPSIMIFTSISERLLLPGLAFALGMLALTLVFGRFYCGWVCPLGTMIDISGSLRRKRDNLKRLPRLYLNIKYLFLFVILGFAAAGVQIAWILDPMGIMARFVSLNLIPTATLLVERSFIFLIRDLGLSGPVHDIYRALRGSLLGVKVHYFDSSLLIFLFFAAVCVSAFFISRIWCRTVCPLGALYSYFARFALMRREVEGCVDCLKCVSDCRMGAITDGRNYLKGECVLCMDCVYACSVKSTMFTFRRQGRRSQVTAHEKEKSGLSRRDFLFLIVSSIFITGAGWGKRTVKRKVIRPPGALEEDMFTSRCIRCGNCMKVCPTNGLQPVMLQSGLEGIWTPQLVPEVGYCEYYCNLCGTVCPTGAIPRLTVEEKTSRKLGVARVDRSTCIAWALNQKCLVCEEHCPVPEKAIKIQEINIGGEIVKRPVVVPELCVGCGICQTKCPVRPERAIKVRP